MTEMDVADLRLDNQRITRPGRGEPAKLVAWLGAVQAQEYGPTKWSLGLRLPRATDAALEQAVDQGSILRTHVLRPTWHFVTPADIRWMLKLTAPEVHRRMSSYDHRLGLEPKVMTRATGVIERALGDGRHLTRVELGAHLARAGLPATSMHLAHIAMYAELEGVICSGPRRGKQFTYALLADRAPGAQRLSREEALAELTLRYFRSHGPATIRDFVWWSGLKTADAKQGLAMNRARSSEVDGIRYWTIGRPPIHGSKPGTTVHLLPIYDEYLVAYRDRHAVPHTVYSSWTSSTRHGLLIGGQLAGTWRIIPAAPRLILEAEPTRRLGIGERRALKQAAARYARFVGVRVSLSVA